MQVLIKKGSIFDEFCKNINIKFNIDMMSDPTTQRPLILSSGSYPDVFFSSNMWDPKEITTYANQGVFIPLEDMIKEYAPNLTAVLDKYELWDTLKINGHIYDIPTIFLPQIVGTQHMYINEKWLENVGMSLPTNTDELYAVLKAFKEKDANGNGDPNDEIPYSGSNGVKLSMSFPYFFDKFVLANGVAFDENNEPYVCAYSETYKEFLRFWQKCYAEGLMEEDMFSQEGDVFSSAGDAGDIYGAFMGFSPNDGAADENLINYTIVPAFTPSGYPSGVSLYRGCLMITDTCENPENIIAWVDQFYTDEGALKAYLGTEGIDYQIADGKYQFLPDVKNPTKLGLGNVPTKEMSEYYINGNDPVNAKLFNVKTGMAANSWTAPHFALSEEQNETITTYLGDMWNYWNTYSAEVIMGMKDLDSTWDQYLKDMEGMGAAKVDAAYKEAWAAINK